jgi:hypothetical protein
MLGGNTSAALVSPSLSPTIRKIFPPKVTFEKTVAAEIRRRAFAWPVQLLTDH